MIAPEAEPSARLLFIDADLDSLEMLVVDLENCGFEVHTASNGPDGLEVACRECPDLILLDSAMPGMDGFEVCRRLKQNPHSAEIPVLFFSVSEDAEDKLKGFSCGVIDYIFKHTTKKKARCAKLFCDFFY